MKELKNPMTGGEVLLKKRGREYFRELAISGWKKRREDKIKWEKEQKKLSKVMK